MPETISVSETAPDKLVVNGVDLLNRSELSNSQNRELQRYIDGHLHLLGYMDKDKQEGGEKDQYSLGNKGANYNQPKNLYGDLRINVNEVPDGTGGLDLSLLNRTNSPASSDYSGKRKGVSWSDANDHLRARSYSPTRFAADFRNPNNQHLQQAIPSEYNQYPSVQGRSHPRYPLIVEEQPYGGDTDLWRNSLPARGIEPQQQRAASYDPYSIKPRLGDSRENLNRNEGYGYKGFPKQIVPTYSTLQRSKDDYNKFETYRFREQQNRASREKDDAVRFGGYGDHRYSGVCEPKPVYWQGGEMVVDPTYYAKSLQPRRFFYSPIGDGVVAADGVELKRLPPDLNPKVTVINQKILEPGDPGRAGIRLTERTWDEGNRGLRGDDVLSESYRPWDDGRGRTPNKDDDDRNKNRFPIDDFSPPMNLENGTPIAPRGQPAAGDRPFDNTNRNLLDGVDDRGSTARPDSGLSFGSSEPREGWTKTFIVNPRECINIYGSETLTTIFDLEDHTPKTMVTVKETLSPVPSKDLDFDSQEETQ